MGKQIFDHDATVCMLAWLDICLRDGSDYYATVNQYINQTQKSGGAVVTQFSQDQLRTKICKLAEQYGGLKKSAHLIASGTNCLNRIPSNIMADIQKQILAYKPDETIKQSNNKSHIPIEIDDEDIEETDGDDDGLDDTSDCIEQQDKSKADRGQKLVSSKSHDKSLAL